MFRGFKAVLTGLAAAAICALAFGAPVIASARNVASPARGLAAASTARARAAASTAEARAADTTVGHTAEDDVTGYDAMTERLLSNRTVARSAAPSRAAAATVSSDPGQSGEWGPIENWPVVAVGAALLPNGNVLAHDAVGDKSYASYVDHTYTRATVWNPTTDTFTPDWVTGFDVFCSGLAHLPDGTMFFAGGNADPNSNGILATHTFDFVTNVWTRGADMTYARWYPTVTATADGEMVITSGRPLIPEVREPDGTIRALSQTGSMSLPLYPWMNVAPDGGLFDSGPDDALRELDPSGAGAWRVFGPRGDGINRSYGSHAMYDIGKILVAGGGPSTPSALTIDINGATPVVQPTSPMNFGRRQFNLTALADGTVLATGGNSDGATYVDMNAGVYNAELWNPATGNWTVLAAESVTRQYHSTALLLPDGRVLSAGGGICSDCDKAGYLAKNAQIFSPPYLFLHDGSGQLAPRPQITDVPGSVTYGASLPITTADAASVQKVGLVRLGAVTHANNMDQRYVPLSFTADGGQLTAAVPQNPNVAPPGYYMLFIINSSGVPSVAKILWVGSTTPPPPPSPPDTPPSVTLNTPQDGASFAAPATINLSATASSPAGTVAKVEYFATQPGILGSDIKLGESTTPPYNFTWWPVPAGTYAITARVTDNQGVTATTPGRATITVGGTAVNGVTPAAGSSKGGTIVHVMGSGFMGATSVWFGATAGTNVQVVDDGDITVTSPKHAAGPVDVQVATPGGLTLINQPTDVFTYYGRPTVLSITSPADGPLAGGNTVNVNGTNFVAGQTTVDFGLTPATSVQVSSSKLLTVVAPAGATAGSVDIAVTTPGGSSATSVNDLYAYGPPTISGFTPGSGITGSKVTITGSGFAAGMTVSLGAFKTTPKIVSGTSLTITVPNGDTVPSTITVSDPQGSQTNSTQFTPTMGIKKFSPVSGSISAGTVVTITGIGFSPDSVVAFNKVNASTTFVDSQHLTAVVPAGSTTGNITVTSASTDNPSGTVTSAKSFTVNP